MKMRQFEILSPLIFKVVARVVLSEGLPAMRSSFPFPHRSDRGLKQEAGWYKRARTS
jgi:hypothetical protein